MPLEKMLESYDRGELHMLIRLGKSVASTNSSDIERILQTRSDLDRHRQDDYETLSRFLKDLECLETFLDMTIEELVIYFDETSLRVHTVKQLGTKIEECWLEENPEKQELQFILFKDNFEVCKRLGLHYGSIEHLQLFDPQRVET